MTNTTPVTRPTCPECGAPMGPAGTVWSGRKKVPGWRCGKCGRRSMNPGKKDAAK